MDGKQPRLSLGDPMYNYLREKSENGEVEKRDFVLLCPTCRKEVDKIHKDDIGTQWYICENGHQTATPPKKKRVRRYRAVSKKLL